MSLSLAIALALVIVSVVIAAIFKGWSSPLIWVAWAWAWLTIIAPLIGR